MARRSRPQGTNLVDFVFGFKEKAMGRKRSKVVPRRLSLSEGVDDVIQRDLHNIFFGTAIDQPTAAVSGALKYNFINRGFDEAEKLKNLVIAAQKRFEWVDKNGIVSGGTKNVKYRIDPTTLDIVDYNTGTPTGRKVTEFDPSLAFNPPAPSDFGKPKTFGQVVGKEIINWGKRRGGAFAESFKILDVTSQINSNPLAVANYLVESVYGRWGAKAKLQKFGDMAVKRFRALNPAATATEIAELQKAVARTFENVVNPYVEFSYETGKFGSGAKMIREAKVDQEMFHLHDHAGGKGRFADFLAASDPEKKALAQAMDDFFDGFKPGIFTDVGVTLGYMQYFPFLDNLMQPDPTKNIGNLVYQFVLTNNGWAKLATNQWLLYYARKYPWAQKLVDKSFEVMLKHPIANNAVTKALSGLGKEIGNAAATQISKLLTKLGFKGGTQALAQALGSFAPVVGNIIAFVSVELLFKLFEPVIKFLGELVKFGFWMIFILLMAAFYAYFSVLTALSPEFSLPQVGVDRPAIGEGVAGDLPLIDGTFVGGLFSDGTCPIENSGGHCTQGYGSGSSPYHQSTRAIDIGVPGGTPVFSPCNGTATPTNRIYIDGDVCAGDAGLGISIKCDNGQTVQFLHVRPVASGRVSAGQQVAVVASNSSVCSTGPHVDISCKSSSGAAIPADQCMAQYGCDPNWCAAY